MTTFFPFSKRQAHLWLVGAGPGDPELLTIKGARALEQADLVLYDSLVHQDVLAHAPAQAVKICVGKRAGQTSTPQALIHDWIEKGARQGLRIVRLKGGDPMVFGRAGEELAFADKLGLPWTYVPGISSGTSLAGLSGIPLTLRGVASSAWLGTATGQDGRLTEDLLQALRTSSTLVVFMGRRRLREIANHLIHLGKGDMPVAVVSEGSLPQQRTVVRTAREWAVSTDLDRVADPALLVLGEVVNHRLSTHTTPLRSIAPTFSHEYQVPHLPQAGKPHVQRLRRV
ncbi:MAG: uroporphyrinogen-III C-methyltransferase [Flavobacteriales bacterium]